MTTNLQTPMVVDPADQARVRDLNSLAVRGLVPMFDPQNQLFCCRLKLTGEGLKREGLSPRYTLITLMGLHKGEAYGLRNPFDSRAIMNGLLASTTWLDNIGDLGLLLWLCALMAPERYEEVYGRFNVATALDQYRDAQEGPTMELAWFLSGLAHGAMAGQRNMPGLTNLAHASFGLIKKNQGRNGVFGHLATRRGIAGALRGHLGSFADQVYPIYALSKFGRAFGNGEALKSAKDVRANHMPASRAARAMVVALRFPDWSCGGEVPRLFRPSGCNGSLGVVCTSREHGAGLHLIYLQGSGMDLWGE